MTTGERAFRRSTFALLFVAGLSSLAPALATNSRAELEAVQRDLLAWWPGEYDTLPQVMLERDLGTPPDGEHDRQYRVFARVDVPHIGAHVIYGEVRSGGKRGTLIKGQQVLYIITIDEQHQAVNVTGRRISDGANFEQAHLYPEKLKTIALDPNYGGNCDFRFRRYGRELRGWLANRGEDAQACTMVSKNSGQTMTWDADWMIGPDAIWVFDNGYMKDPAKPQELGRLFAGRDDLTHERLYKGRDFACAFRPAGGSAARPVSAVVHDRGGEFDVPGAGSGTAFARLLRRERAAAAPVFIEQVLTLAVLEPGRTEAVASAVAADRASSIALKYPAGSISCRQQR